VNNRTPLQSHRRAVGLSQEDVADACTVAVSTVRRWESGEVLPQPKVTGSSSPPYSSSRPSNSTASLKPGKHRVDVRRWCALRFRATIRR
jgi:DNA-binding XRE family transcriptional regulator